MLAQRAAKRVRDTHEWRSIPENAYLSDELDVISMQQRKRLRSLDFE